MATALSIQCADCIDRIDLRCRLNKARGQARPHALKLQNRRSSESSFVIRGQLNFRHMHHINHIHQIVHDHVWSYLICIHGKYMTYIYWSFWLTLNLRGRSSGRNATHSGDHGDTAKRHQLQHLCQIEATAQVSTSRPRTKHRMASHIIQNIISTSWFIWFIMKSWNISRKTCVKSTSNSKITLPLFTKYDYDKGFPRNTSCLHVLSACERPSTWNYIHIITNTAWFWMLHHVHKGLQIKHITSHFITSHRRLNLLERNLFPSPCECEDVHVIPCLNMSNLWSEFHESNIKHCSKVSYETWT